MFFFQVAFNQKWVIGFLIIFLVTILVKLLSILANVFVEYQFLLFKVIIEYLILLLGERLILIILEIGSTSVLLARTILLSVFVEQVFEFLFFVIEVFINLIHPLHTRQIIHIFIIIWKEVVVRLKGINIHIHVFRFIIIAKRWVLGVLWIITCQIDDIIHIIRLSCARMMGILMTGILVCFTRPVALAPILDFLR